VYNDPEKMVLRYTYTEGQWYEGMPHHYQLYTAPDSQCDDGRKVLSLSVLAIARIMRHWCDYNNYTKARINMYVFDHHLKRNRGVDASGRPAKRARKE
jgi:hypothetical protein